MRGVVSEDTVNIQHLKFPIKSFKFSQEPSSTGQDVPSEHRILTTTETLHRVNQTSLGGVDRKWHFS